MSRAETLNSLSFSIIFIFNWLYSLCEALELMWTLFYNYMKYFEYEYTHKSTILYPLTPQHPS